MSERPDLGLLRDWIGAVESAEDILTPALAERFHATLSLPGVPPGPGDTAARLIHFCLAQPAVPMAGLGDDGHPARGGFLPPVPLPSRMWAGSTIAFHSDLRVGDVVRRQSRIADVTIKEGRTGTLCFVTVDHAFSVGGELKIEDRQTIVYRGPSKERPGPGDAAPTGATVVMVNPTPTLLFRYSALTFNGHRIHYDAPYARDVEGYSGLVVHGPLQATMLLHLATVVAGRPPDRFSFRSQSTLFDSEPLYLHAGEPSDSGLALWTAHAAGPAATLAEASWQ